MFNKNKLIYKYLAFFRLMLLVSFIKPVVICSCAPMTPEQAVENLEGIKASLNWAKSTLDPSTQNFGPQNWAQCGVEMKNCIEKTEHLLRSTKHLPDIQNEMLEIQKEGLKVARLMAEFFSQFKK